MNEAQHLADRYVAAWNETDPAARRSAIESLWTRDGQHYVDTRQAIGFAALEDRISRSHEKNVSVLGHRFRAVQDARRLRNAVTFHWQMLPADSDARYWRPAWSSLILNDEVDASRSITSSSFPDSEAGHARHANHSAPTTTAARSKARSGGRSCVAGIPSLARKSRHARAALVRMTARELADIGITPSDRQMVLAGCGWHEPDGNRDIGTFTQGRCAPNETDSHRSV